MGPVRALLAAPALLLGVLTSGAAVAPAPAAAQILSGNPWRLVEAGQRRKVADSALAVAPMGAWNRLARRPTKRSEVWTRDGISLNELTFFAIPKGKPLFREQDKKKAPLPKFDPAMLPTDLVEWFESSARIVLGGSLFEVSQVRPAKLAGADGVHFAFSYTSEADNLERMGEVRAAVVGGKLYAISFDAARIHYFDAHIGDVRALMDSATLVAGR